MTQNKKIAVTGGIGSGKSIFCEIIKKKGYSVFSCDDISRQLWKSEEYLCGLKKLFPQCVADSVLDRKRVSAAVFADEEKREALNAYAHPKIMRELLARMQGEGVFFAEVPLLFEGGYENLFDKVIALKRAYGDRIASLALRDGLNETEILARMNSQFDPERLAEKKCIVIENNGSLADLEKRAEEIIATL